MDPIEKRELKRKAWMRLAAQRRRAGLLRGRVVVMSLLCFAVIWGVVFAQMATGNDPVLSSKEKAAATQTAANTRRNGGSTNSRELEPERSTDSKSKSREAESEAQTVLGPKFEGVEPEFEEAEFEEVGAEAEFEEVEAEPEFVEEEVEPLVTSQS